MLTDEAIPEIRKKSAGRAGKLALLIVGILLILAGVGAVSYSRRDVTPHIHVVVPPLPNPNAFDYFARAAGEVIDQRGRVTLIPTPANRAEFNPLSWRLSPEAKAATLANNRATLAEIRKGFAFPYQSPALLASAPLPEYDAKYPTLARLFLLESYAKLAHGDWAGEVSDDFDAMQVGEVCPRGGGVGSRGYGSLCQGIGRHDIWEAVDHLSAPQARAAIGRLRQVVSLHVPFSETLQDEKWTMQDKMMRIFQEPDWRSRIPPLVAYRNISVEPSPLLKYESKQTVMANYTDFMDRLIMVVSQPYNSTLREPEIPSDPANKVLVFPGMYDGLWFRNVIQETENQLLLAALALRAYHLEHGAYPAALADLTPGYLPDVPADPFSVDGHVLYRQTGQTYVLYSVGPDGRDDGGKPLDNNGPRDGHWRYLPQPDSKGDMVVRINCG